MTTEYLTPFDQGEARVDLANKKFRKQILAKATIRYDDHGQSRVIKFDDAYLRELADNFNNGAMDQVPFQLADHANRHTDDPERTRGELVGVEVTPDGLDGIFSLTDEGVKVIESNPKLAVSARIAPPRTRADGKKVGKHLMHVLGTLDPRLNGMRPWQAVELANPADVTVDLTEATVQPELPTQPETTEDTPSEPSEPAGEPVSPHDPDIEEDEDKAAQRALATAMKQEVTMTAPAAHQDATEALELANQRIAELTERQASTEAQLAAERFDRERTALIQDGVPPAMVDLAAPLLSLPHPPVLELANSDRIDVPKLVRDLLAQAKGFVELHAERGHTFTNDPEEDREQQILAAWKVG